MGEEAERRVVTVLFGDLSDFTSWAEDRDPERVGVVTDRVLAALADIVTGVGGHVDKLTGDGIMAVFGAPTAHEDDAQRAVRAAAAMQAAVGQLVRDEGGTDHRLGLRVGLNTGEVLAGVQGHLSYTVVGDTVNTASRLSDSAAVGATFAGRGTAVATMQVASWRTLPPLRLKGKREPVEAYEFVGLRAAFPARLGTGDEAPMIGREPELAALIDRFDALADPGRAPATALLVGEAGIGKTRLAVELGRYAATVPGAQVLWGRCIPYGLGRDLSPLTEIARGACGIAEDDSPDVASDRVRRVVAGLELSTSGGFFPSMRADRLLELLGLGQKPAIDSEVPREGATGGRRGRWEDLQGLIWLLSAMAARGRLVLVVDDLQDARAPLRDALLELMTRVSGPVLLVGAGRPEMLDPGRGGWAGLPHAELIPVQALADQETQQLLSAHLGGAQLAVELGQALLGRAQGNPFFLAELVHLLVDRGDLVDTPEGGWELTGQLPAQLLPAGVQAVLAARIDSLDPRARALLRDAAVLGTSFPASALTALDPRIDPGTVIDVLGEITRRGILRAEGDGRYAFAHRLTRDVAYAGLPKVDRARRHAAAASWAEGHMQAAVSEVDAVVAVQAERAVRLAEEMGLPRPDPAWGAAAPGASAATRLGELALARDDYPAAEAHLARALRLSVVAGESGDRLLAVHVAYAQALTGQRRLAEAQEQLEAPLASDLPDVRAGALVVLGELRHKGGDDDGARGALVQAFVLAGAAGLDGLTGAAIRQLGLLDYFGGRLGDAEERFREALELARRVRDARGAGWALQHLAWAATTRGDYLGADRALLQAREVFLGLQDSGGLAWCAGTEALVRVLQGRLIEARGLVAGLLPAASALGTRWETAACLTIDAIAGAELGDLEVAAREAALAATAFAALGDPWGRSLAMVAAGLVARGNGQTREARAAFRRAAATAAEGGHRVQELLATVSLGLLQLDRGDVKAAAAAASKAEALADGLDLLDSALMALRVLRARVLRARGRLPEAAELLSTALGAEVPSLLFPRRQALAHLAAVFLEQGDPEGALATIMRALSTPAEDVRSQVVTQRVLAQVLRAGGDVEGAAAAAAEALRLVEVAGIDGELAATRKLVERIGVGQ